MTFKVRRRSYFQPPFFKI